MKNLRAITFSLGFLALTSCAFAQWIHLKYDSFDPAVRTPSIPQELVAGWISGETHYILQFARRPSAQELGRVASVVRLGGYLPEHAYVVAATPSQVSFLRGLPGVRWLGAFQPAYKLSNDIGHRSFYSNDRISERLGGMYRFTATLFDGADAGATLAKCARSGIEVISASRVGPRWVLSLRGTLDKAAALAHMDDVGFIEESADHALRNDITKWVGQSNTNGEVPVWNKGIRGENQIAGLIDSKVYMPHNMFKDASNNTPGPNHRKVIYYSSQSGFGGGDFHGTHTAGTFAGDQEPITGSIVRNGMAYRAKIAFTNLNDVWGGDLYSALLGAHNVGARVHSNSWGDDGTTQYTSDCQQIDQYSWDHENGMVAFAVTNLNSLKTPENAKSVLAVGASEQAPNQAQHGSGGAGPTNDGRRKPEVYSPGVGIWSAQSGNPNGYAQATGTSMACPSASGFGLLARQYYTEGWLRTGAANPVDGFEPSGALLRATLMNGSVDMTGIAGYPSNSEGWGRILLDNVLWFAGEPRRTLAWDIRNATGLVTGQTYTGAAIAVQTSSLPLRVTMSFTDYPAQVFTNFAAVNDVDLEVVAPDGTVYRGNVFSGGQSTSGGAADVKNSTEMVVFNTPAPGIYRIRVKAREVNQGGRQGFALVANGRISPASRSTRS